MHSREREKLVSFILKWRRWLRGSTEEDDRIDGGEHRCSADMSQGAGEQGRDGLVLG